MVVRDRCPGRSAAAPFPAETVVWRSPGWPARRAAIAGAWRAADGSAAIAIASNLSEPMAVSSELHPRAHGLEGGGQIARIGEGGRNALGTFRAEATPIRSELRPGGAYGLEFRRGYP
jgi:hypothetical protein